MSDVAQPANTPAVAVANADVVNLAVPFVAAADEVSGEIRGWVDSGTRSGGAVHAHAQEARRRTPFELPTPDLHPPLDAAD